MILLFCIILVGVGVALFDHYHYLYLEKINNNILDNIEKRINKTNSLSDLRLISNDLELLVYKSKEFPSYKRIIEIEDKIQTRFEDILNNW